MTNTTYRRTASRGLTLATMTAALALLGACGSDPEAPVANADSVPDAMTDEVESDPAGDGETTGSAPGCPVIDSRNWTASIDGDTLRVSGEIDLPTPGFTVIWKEGPADRRQPPAQHLLLELLPPEGMVAQMIDTVTVDYEGAATYPEYRSILVRCGDQVLAAIVDIEQGS